MINQRALEAAYQAVSSTPNDSGDGFMFHDPGDAWKVTWRAIEAYEAAKQEQNADSRAIDTPPAAEEA